MKELTPYARVDDDGVLHIGVPELLDEMGVEDTAENREKALAMATEILKELLKDTPAVIRTYD